MAFGTPADAANAVEVLRQHQSLHPRAETKDAHQGSRQVSVSSDLSVDEMLAVESVGYEPVSLVTGSAAFRIPVSRRYAYWKANMEVDAFTNGFLEARAAAMKKIRGAAAAHGADGVVGLRLELLDIPKAGDEVRCSATGTAVRTTGTGAVTRPKRHGATGPFTASLSGQDFALLVRSGYAPLDLVMGVCVFHIGRRAVSQTLKTLPRNAELEVITDALSQSRELAMGRMKNEAASHKADGVVGVRIEEKTHAWGSRVIEFLSIGTAVCSVSKQNHPLRPDLIVPLDP